MSWYNDEYQHGAIRVATPSQRHDCPDVVVLAHPREAPLPVAPSDGRGNWNVAADRHHHLQPAPWKHDAASATG